ncbi:lysophospholipid acyltransferase family protein [Motilimonas cestriensis]|uniref:lysophospholipid acyltransferase family protein n=1 Tax=Motilimonas cestriensis TaxID=2742685 RepID=UPI003DA2D9D3
MLRAKLNQAWRLFGTAVSFAFFGVGGLILSLLLLLITFIIKPSAKRIYISRYLIQRTFRFFVFLMKSLGVLRCHIDLPLVAPKRGVLITPNHPSLIDVVLLIAHIEQVNCVVKASLWRSPFVGLIVRSAGYIPNSAGEEVLSLCRQSFEAGQSVIVFPEGTRTEPNSPLKLQRGAANIALRAEADIVLVHISVSPKTLAKADAWYQIPIQQPCFKVVLGATVDAKQVTKDCSSISLAARVLTRYLTKALSQ